VDGSVELIRSFAKLNIGLHFTGRRVSDGYHLLESLFLEIDVHDTLKVKLKRSGEFNLSCSDPSVPTDASNTVLRALERLGPSLPQELGADIHLVKRIPHGAGLGGGSSNAAAVLRLFSAYSSLSEKQLLNIAASVGADVPFFMKGGLQYVTGIGDILRPLDYHFSHSFLLVFPEFTVNTAEAYRSLNLPLHEKLFPAKFAGCLTRPLCWELFENEFEDVINPAHPQVKEIRTALDSAGAVYSSLSGSGSTVYGAFENEAAAAAAADRLKGRWPTIVSRAAQR